MGDCEAWLNKWIINFVNGNQDASAEMKAKFPLAEASVSVKEVPGQPGVYNAVGLDAALAADGGTHGLHAHGGPHTEGGLIRIGREAWRASTILRTSTVTDRVRRAVDAADVSPEPLRVDVVDAALGRIDPDDLDAFLAEDNALVALRAMVRSGRGFPLDRRPCVRM